MDLSDLHMPAVMLLGLLSALLIAWHLPASWRRSLYRTRQDEVNEQTVTTLESIAKALDTMGLRLDLLSWEVDRLKAPMASAPSAPGTSTTEGARSG